MHESLIFTTKGGKDAPARVRAALAALNGGLGGKSDDVRLVATELVANAVVHASVGHEGFLTFGLSAASDKIEGMLVYTGEPFTPRPQPEDRHFGLHLVDSLSDRWGVVWDDDK